MRVFFLRWKNQTAAGGCIWEFEPDPDGREVPGSQALKAMLDDVTALLPERNRITVLEFNQVN